MCLYPRLIPNPKYRTSKKRGYYKPSPHDARLNYVPVACGKCYECRKKKAREWRIRLAEEIRHNKSYFVTLTIDDENLEMLKNELEVKSVKGNENNIATLALRKFLERCRKKTGKSLKHWCVTQLGEDRGRIHLHGIFFGNNAAELAIEKWKYGYIFIGNYERLAQTSTRWNWIPRFIKWGKSMVDRLLVRGSTTSKNSGRKNRSLDKSHDKCKQDIRKFRTGNAREFHGT